MVHAFDDSRQRSDETACQPWVEDLYRQFFPNLLCTNLIRKDGWAQRAGVDRLVVLGDGTVLAVEEKFRYKAYGDFCLEYLSNDKSGALGWMAKDHACNYLAYIIVPNRHCYLLPWQLLRRAWLANSDEWLAHAERGERGFRIAKSPNRAYNTLSICVPRQVLFRALFEAMSVRLEA